MKQNLRKIITGKNNNELKRSFLSDDKLAQHNRTKLLNTKVMLIKSLNTK